MAQPTRTSAGRGGDRTSGRKLSTNTSGVNAIRFAFDGDNLRVYVAAGDQRTSFSVARNGRRGACQSAIAWRIDRGYPTPSLSSVLRRLREFTSQ